MNFADLAAAVVIASTVYALWAVWACRRNREGFLDFAGEFATVLAYTLISGTLAASFGVLLWFSILQLAS